MKRLWRQVKREEEAAGRGELPALDEAATLIQSAWRMKQAQQQLQRLKHQQEAQAKAAAAQQVSLPVIYLTAGTLLWLSYSTDHYAACALM